MDIVFIYGPPGVGKLTVARELSRLTGYKLFHNHISIDWAREFFEFGTPPFWRLSERLRRAVFAETIASSMSLIMTFVYSVGEDLPNLEAVCREAEANGGRTCMTQLVCDPEVLEQRVVSEERQALRKLVSMDGLRAWMRKNDPAPSIPGHESLRIDNTHLAPDAVALRILEHFSLPTA